MVQSNKDEHKQLANDLKKPVFVQYTSRLWKTQKGQGAGCLESTTRKSCIKTVQTTVDGLLLIEPLDVIHEDDNTDVVNGSRDDGIIDPF
ncbi:unnamed protein product [Rodentolepis nana]|uniref:Uncharacterized protein n=1 Tax=Rodentolepis nana TaxID=102285 RepID=A0A0R3TRX6_RODNA|nr:unnamed protein product [Rodentolepis nana]